MLKSWKKFNESNDIYFDKFSQSVFKNFNITIDTITDILQDVMDDFPNFSIEIIGPMDRTDRNRFKIILTDSYVFNGEVVDDIDVFDVEKSVKILEEEIEKLEDGGYTDQIYSRMEEIGFKSSRPILYKDSIFFICEKI